MKRGYQVAATLTALFLTGVAQAHPFGMHGAEFGPASAHSFFTLDHLLPLLAVGVLAVALAGRAIWRVLQR